MARILGFDIARSAPRLRASGTAFEQRSRLAEVGSVSPSASARIRGSSPWLQAVGELPVDTTSGRPAPSPGRLVPSDPLGDFYLALPDKLTPAQVSQILRQSLAGNILQQTQLAQRMRDSWPRFRKCEYELRAAVASSRYVVHPYAEPGMKPTDGAREKADLVRRNLEAFKPDRFSDEEGCHGMLYDLTGAVTDGVSIVELLWDEDAKAPDGSPESRVRASAYVHPRHYAFGADGRLGVAQSQSSNWLSFPAQMGGVPGPSAQQPAKFLVSKFKSKSGSCLGAGLIRPLAWYWCAVVYPREFLFLFAQKHGSPFMDIPYEAGIGQAEIDRIESLAEQAANQGWFIHPDSAKVNVVAAQSAGSDNPQVVLMRLADAACAELMLGQNLTTESPKQGGSRAQGDVHMDVRQERLEGLSHWLAQDVLTEQFAESLLQVNYGDASERPTVDADMTRPMGAMEQAQYLGAVAACPFPLPVVDVCKKLGVPVPQQGDLVTVQGRIGILGDTETDIEANPAPTPPPQFFPQTGAPGQPGEPASKGGGEEGEDDGTLLGAVRRAVARASDEELEELDGLVRAAEAAPRHNGEVAKVRGRLETMANGRRR